MASHREIPTPYLKEILASLQVISTLETQGADLNRLHLHYARLVKKLLDSEMTAMLIVDPEDERIIIRKVLIGEQDWSLEDSFQVDYNDLYHSFKDSGVIQLKEYCELIDQFDCLDLLNRQPFKNNLLAPVMSGSRLIAIFQAVNCRTFPIESIKLDLIHTVCAAFSTALSNLYAIRQLKIDNANLEAWRWELLQSRNTLRAMFDSTPTAIYIIDNQYRVVAINASRSTRANRKPNELVGQVCYEALYERTQPCQGCRVSETFLSGRTASRSDREWVANDQFIDWEITSYAILDESENPIQVIINEQDVTVEKRLEANLVQSEKLAAVGQLAAGVAHEINNPLSAVIANAQLLRRDLPEDATDALESVELIEVAGMRASQVVRNLLGFARKEQYEFLPIDLNETILNSLSLVKHEFVTRRSEIYSDLMEDMPLFNCSKEHMQSVWINIILNALDSIEEGKGKVNITSSYKNEEFRITISDNGVGIPPDRVSRIFEPFFTTKSPGRGTGLGLSVCHRIIKQHGGYIQVDSLMDMGTKFTIVLPEQGG